jgi:hypothetical protein
MFSFSCLKCGIFLIKALIFSIWPDIRLFSVSGIQLDIRQVKSGIRPDTGYLKRPDYPAGYPVHRYFQANKKVHKSNSSGIEYRWLVFHFFQYYTKEIS